jgi:hypothetical protein
MICQLANRPFLRKSQVILFLFFLFFFNHRSSGQCSVTVSGPGNSFSNNTGVGSLSWSSVSNIALSDNVHADNGVLLGVLGNATTNYLVVQNFGFSIPSSASICGIEVTIERKVTGLLVGSSVRDNSIRLLKNNVISGTNLASSSNWPGSDGNAVYGDVNETWGSAWTAADINAANFGVAISARLSAGLASLFLTAEIDQVTIRVFFNIVLPVRLINFKAIQQEDKVKLEWATASENNSHHFTVERSIDGVSGWQPINSVAAAGNSSTMHHYQAIDQAPLPISFYRLRQTDLNGVHTFSNIVAFLINKEKTALQVYPNPVYDQMTIIFPGKADRILLKNISGSDMTIKNISSIAGGIKVKLPELQKGYYWLIIQTAQQTYTKKIMVL